MGDRIRMIRHYNDKDVYIRSMASRGGHGGLAQATQEVGDIFLQFPFFLHLNVTF